MPLVEFAYNNSYQASIGMAPYAALYGRRCRSPLSWDDIGDRELRGPDMIVEAVEVARTVRDRLRVAQTVTSTGLMRRDVIWSSQKGDLVFLRISPTRGLIHFGRRESSVPGLLDLSPWMHELARLLTAWFYRIHWLRCIQSSMCHSYGDASEARHVLWTSQRSRFAQTLHMSSSLSRSLIVG